MSERQTGSDTVGKGCALMLGFHVLAFFVVLVLGAALSSWVPWAIFLGVYWFVLLLGVTQLVYMIPAVLIARRRGRPNTAKGLIIGAAVTFLLNAGCWVLVDPEGLQDLLRGRLPY